MSKGPPLSRTPLRLVALLGFGATASLVGVKSLGRGENLSVDDGTPSASVLPLDRETSKRDFQTATFGLGWFWTPDAQFGTLKGVLRTRVGYTGGTTEDPTYRNLGDHTEAIAIDFDPDAITYQELLKRFWAGHYCGGNIGSRQYMNVVFYHNDEQKRAIEKTKAAAAANAGIASEAVKTAILPAGRFTYAEGYHQKYALRRGSKLREFLTSTYPDAKSLADSAVATRLNAYLGSGFDRDLRKLEKEIGSYGLPEMVKAEVLRKARAR